MSKLSRRALLATAAGLVAVGSHIARAQSPRTSGTAISMNRQAR